MYLCVIIHKQPRRGYAKDMSNQSFEVIVRKWDSRNVEVITREEWEAAEKKAGKNSAFAETRKIIFGQVEDTGMDVSQYIRYRNA